MMTYQLLNYESLWKDITKLVPRELLLLVKENSAKDKHEEAINGYGMNCSNINKAISVWGLDFSNDGIIIVQI